MHGKDGDEKIHESDTGPAALYVWKTTADPFVGKMTYFKVISGVVTADAHFWNQTKGADERMGGLHIQRGNEQLAVKNVHAGDIETATIHHFYPGLADVPKAKSLPPVELGDDKIMTWLFGGHTKELSSAGYLGAPADFESVDVIKNINDIADRISEAILERLAKA